ncbi:hypothetical protein [Vibrio rotiferianus]|uniref:hypothetical protein n=1 Tax=Vibrio rotiferianus TaxID=190895 RepID=UPI0005EF6D97|nr:hypothetical protein [Vibrio rotiferianus]
MSYLTVEDLLDIVDSQAILYGDRAVFVKLPSQCQEVSSDFFLHADGKLIIEAGGTGEACKEDNGLVVIEKRLESLEPSLMIECSHNAPMTTGFALGFKADGQFVEVIHSNEIEPPVACG